MIRADQHTHTDFSGDCQSPMELMIKAAILQGLTHYAITDHLDIDFPPCGIDFTLDVTQVHQTIDDYKEVFQDSIRLLKGVEYGLQPHLGDDLKALSKMSGMDIIIGSCHLAQGVDPYQPEYFKNRSRDEGYRVYFEQILQSIEELEGFDTLGHMDYVIRYWRGEGSRFYSYRDFSDLLDAILDALIRKEIALEVNTAGYPYRLNQPHPSYHVLRRYFEKGGRLLTIGSDAHLPERVAESFDETEAELRKIGFKGYTVFMNRKPHEFGFED